MSVRTIPPQFSALELPSDVSEPGRAARVDWTQIREAARGRVAGITRAQAIGVLVAARHPSADRDLQAVLHDPTAPGPLRALTALSLVRLGSQVESILIDAI